jgi:hypothetical protein
MNSISAFCRQNPSAPAATGYGNAVCRGKPQTTGKFSDILQEQISKTGAAESEIPHNIARWTGLKNGVPGQFDSWAEIEARGPYDGFAKDFELLAYVEQLALENGIKSGGTLENPDYMGMGRRLEFRYQVWQLLDRGLISRQDVIDAVKFPPKISINGDGGGITPNMDGFGKSNKYMELTYAMELFETLWGKRGE